MNLDIFGQIVIGPPGSGKTTYCHGMQQILKGIGRKAVIVNMDPANDALPYECAIDIAELITLSEVMDKMNLGPNGGLVYCMEYLETNLTWLIERLRQQCSSGTYVIIDCPGQVELYTHHQAVRNIVERLVKLDFRLCAVHLVDSHNCTDPAKFIAVLLTSLATMLQIELPLVNVLSKADLIEKQHKLQFNVDFYTDVLDLNYLLDLLSDDPFTKKHKKLNAALVGLIESYSLVSFNALDIQNKESVLRVLTLVDKANGYIFGSGEERNIQYLLSTAIGADSEYFKAAHVKTEPQIHDISTNRL